MAPTIFILLDGLRYDTARACLGYMEALVRAGEAQVYRVASELPSISRPLYETLMTGTPPAVHGIVSNGVVRRSVRPNVFDIARQNGLTTAAAAFCWFSELYNRAPFERADRFVVDGEGGIQHGVFYWRDHYPDDHLFADADELVRRHCPDFLLLHPMNADDVGHKQGGASPAYRNVARVQSDLLALHIPGWRARGYQIVVTADHGMGDDGNHGGADPSEAEVALYTVGDRFSLDPEATLKQTEIAGLLCDLLGVAGHGLPSPAGFVQEGATRAPPRIAADSPAGPRGR